MVSSTNSAGVMFQYAVETCLRPRYANVAPSGRVPMFVMNKFLVRLSLNRLAKVIIKKGARIHESRPFLNHYRFEMFINYSKYKSISPSGAEVEIVLLSSSISNTNCG